MIGFFNGNVNFEKKIDNSKVNESSIAILGFIDFYCHIYS